MEGLKHLVCLFFGVIGNIPGGVIYALEGFASTESPSRNHQDHGNLERVRIR